MNPTRQHSSTQPEMSTGNAIVDAIGQMHFEGPTIPRHWHQAPELKLASGLTNLPALLVLADLVYCGLATVAEDEADGPSLQVRTEFGQAELWKRYKAQTDLMGLSERQARDAVAFLHRRGVIRQS